MHLRENMNSAVTVNIMNCVIFCVCCFCQAFSLRTNEQNDKKK